jgi:hypothetical protein
MNITAGILLLLVGVALVVVARPKDGVPRTFMKGTFVEMLYPVLCLGVLVIGVSLVISEILSWQS